VQDPLASREETSHEYGIEIVSWDKLPVADALVLAVAHHDLMERPPRYFLPKVILRDA
jgi:UDP-N-acetyl-D-glucosamine/UDP-N-acetyl-D-galactosamine dehydrogenase